jgi:tetratricopeptide (TPR) repeat protein
MRRALAAALVLLAAAGAAGCGGREPAGGGLVPLEMPDLSRAEPQVERQLADAKAAVDRAEAAEAPAAERAAAWGELGLAFMAYQYTAEALAALTNAHRLAPDDWRWRYLLGYVHDTEGRQEEAVRQYEATLEERPDYVPARIRLGRLRLALGEVEAAEAQFRRALEQAPGFPAALEGLGRAATARDDHAEAVRRFRQALAAAPDASSLHYLLGQALRRAGDLEAAQRELARAGDAEVQISDPLLSQVAGRAESAQFYLVQAAEAAADERFEQAAGAFQRVLEIDPESFAAHRGLGYVLERLGDETGSERHMRRALETAGTPAEEAEAAAILGNLAVARGADDEARELYRRSLELDPQQTAARLKLADTLARQGRMAEALDEYDRLLASEEGRTAAVRVRRATALVNLGRGGEALAEFRRAVEQAPESVGVRQRYAEALEYLGRPAEAAAERRRAEALSSEGDERLARLAGEGRLAASRGDFETAVARYREALEVAPERQEVRLALAGVLGHLRRWDEALAEYHRVIEAEPDSVAARRGEIAALILSGRYGPARVQLNEALRRFSRDLGLATTQVRLLAAAPDPRVRDAALALEVARRIQQAAPGLPAQDTLAMALAANGELAEAARLQREVVEGARAAGAPAGDLAMLERRLATYEAGRPWLAGEPAELLAFGG